MDDFKFAVRMQRGLMSQCRFCKHLEKKSKLEEAMFTKIEEDTFSNLFEFFLEAREECKCFQTKESVPIERDTTYPGATFAPWDHHDHLLDDSSDEYHIYNQPERCINQLSKTPEVLPPINNWDVAINKLLNRKRKEFFPYWKQVVELLATSRIPEFVFNIGLPPNKGMGYDRGLWFFFSDRFNTKLDENKQKTSIMKKQIMVYLYRIWFDLLKFPKTIYVSTAGEARVESDEENAARNKSMREGIYYLLENAPQHSLASDLAWWMLNTFKAPEALYWHPVEEEVETVSMSLLDKALASIEIEADAEAKAYDEMLRAYGYTEEEINGEEEKELY